MGIKTYERNPAHFLTTPRQQAAWQAALEKAKVKLDLLTDTDMLLKTEKGIREGICHAIHRCAKKDNICIKKLITNT